MMLAGCKSFFNLIELRQPTIRKCLMVLLPQLRTISTELVLLKAMLARTAIFPIVLPQSWLAVETMIFFVVEGSKNLTECHATIMTMLADQKHPSLEVMNYLKEISQVYIIHWCVDP